MACLFGKDVTVPGERVLASFDKTRGPPISREQYTAFLLWWLAGFSALAWDLRHLKCDQWQCKGAGVNLSFHLLKRVAGVEFRVVLDCIWSGIGWAWSLPLLSNACCSRNLRNVSAQAGPVALFKPPRPSVCTHRHQRPSVRALVRWSA